MSIYHFSPRGFFSPFAESQKRPSRDAEGIGRFPRPRELASLLRGPRCVSASPSAADSRVSGRPRLVSRLLRRHFFRDSRQGVVLMPLLFLAISALCGLPWTNLHLILLSLPVAAALLEVRKMFFLAAVLFVGIHSSALADQSKSWSGSAEILFEGTSTLHNWRGKLPTKPFQTRVTLQADGKPKRVQAEVVLEAAKMDTAEPKRDENMRKAMKVTEHPLIQAVIDVPADKIAADLKTPTELPMTLTLLGKPQQITGTISHFQRQDGKVTFELDFPVSMKASGISVPSVLLFIRVGDVVRVHASVTLTQS